MDRLHTMCGYFRKPRLQTLQLIENLQHSKNPCRLEFKRALLCKLQIPSTKRNLMDRLLCTRGSILFSCNLQQEAYRGEVFRMMGIKLSMKRYHEYLCMPFHCQYDMTFFYCRVTLKALIIPERMLAADVTFSIIHVISTVALGNGCPRPVVLFSNM